MKEYATSGMNIIGRTGPFFPSDRELEKGEEYHEPEYEDMTDEQKREWDHDEEYCKEEDCPYCEPDYREKGY